MSRSNASVAYRVLDAMNAPHGGRILRLRLESGETPPVGSLAGARLAATSPAGERSVVRVLGFAVLGGTPSNERFARTGRVDLHVEVENPGAPEIGLRWEVRPA